MKTVDLLSFGWRCEERQRCCYISLSQARAHCALLYCQDLYFTSGNYNAPW